MLEQLKSSLCILIDCSGSMKSKLAKVKEELSRLEEFISNEEIAQQLLVATFSKDLRLVKEFQTSGIDLSFEAKGSSSTLAAIRNVVSILGDQGVSSCKIILITDSYPTDNISPFDIRKQLKQSGIELTILSLTNKRYPVLEYCANHIHYLTSVDDLDLLSYLEQGKPK